MINDETTKKRIIKIAECLDNENIESALEIFGKVNLNKAYLFFETGMLLTICFEYYERDELEKAEEI